MNNRSLWILAGVTLLVVALAALTLESDSGGEPTETGRFFPALLDSVNEVARVTLEDAGGKVTLVRNENGWGLSEKHDYPVDLDRVTSCIKGIALLETVEAKTREPKRYAALGVEGVAEGSASMVVTLADDAGTTLASLILGQHRGGRATGEEFYARKADEAQSWLVSGVVERSADPASWVDKKIAAVERARVQAILVEHADGETLRIGKALESDTTYTVHDVPEDRELSYPTVADGMANTLEWLNLDDVVPSSELELGEDWSTKTTFWTFDGMKIEATLTPKDGDTWARLVASVDEDGAPFVEAPAPEEGAEEAEPAPERAVTDEVKAEVERLNARLSLWTYKLPVHSLTSLGKRMEQLLKPLPVEEEEGGLQLPEDGASDPMEGVEIQDLLSPEQIEQLNREHGIDIPTKSPEDGR